MAQLAARRIPDPKVGGSNPSSLIQVFFYFLRVCMLCACMCEYVRDNHKFLGADISSGLGLVQMREMCVFVCAYKYLPV